MTTFRHAEWQSIVRRNRVTPSPRRGPRAVRAAMSCGLRPGRPCDRLRAPPRATIRERSPSRALPCHPCSQSRVAGPDSFERSPVKRWPRYPPFHLRLEDPHRSRTTATRSPLSITDIRPEIPANGLMSATEAVKRQSISLEVHHRIVSAQTARELVQPLKGPRHGATAYGIVQTPRLGGNALSRVRISSRRGALPKIRWTGEPVPWPPPVQATRTLAAACDRGASVVFACFTIHVSASESSASPTNTTRPSVDESYRARHDPSHDLHAHEKSRARGREPNGGRRCRLHIAGQAPCHCGWESLDVVGNPAATERCSSVFMELALAHELP